MSDFENFFSSQGPKNISINENNDEPLAQNLDSNVESTKNAYKTKNRNVSPMEKKDNSPLVKPYSRKTDKPNELRTVKIINECPNNGISAKRFVCEFSYPLDSNELALAKEYFGWYSLNNSYTNLNTTENNFEITTRVGYIKFRDYFDTEKFNNDEADKRKKIVKNLVKAAWNYHELSNGTPSVQKGLPISYDSILINPDNLDVVIIPTMKFFVFEDQALLPVLFNLYTRTTNFMDLEEVTLFSLSSTALMILNTATSIQGISATCYESFNKGVNLFANFVGVNLMMIAKEYDVYTEQADVETSSQTRVNRSRPNNRVKKTGDTVFSKINKLIGKNTVINELRDDIKPDADNTKTNTSVN